MSQKLYDKFYDSIRIFIENNIITFLDIYQVVIIQR